MFVAVPLPPRLPPRRAVGLDLGQAMDFTALCLMEWNPPVPPRILGQLPARPVYQVPTMHRWPLGTSYTEIVAGVARFLVQPELAGAVLVVDETGCGRPVVEMLVEGLYRAGTRCGLIGVTITNGSAVTLVGNGIWHVAKRTLVSCLQVLLQQRRLQISPQLPEARVLVEELANFRVKITTAANETFESWRERDHDDLVLAVTLASWAAESLHPWPAG